MTEDAERSARRLAEQHGLRFVDLTQSALVPGAASLLPEEVARRHHAVPIGRRLGTPVIAVSDPGDLFAMDALRASVGREYVAVVARPDQVDRAILHLYTPSEPEVPVPHSRPDPGGWRDGDGEPWPGGQAQVAQAQVAAEGAGLPPASDRPGEAAGRDNGTNGHGGGGTAVGAATLGDWGPGDATVPGQPPETSAGSLQDILSPTPVEASPTQAPAPPPEAAYDDGSATVASVTGVSATGGGDGDTSDGVPVAPLPPFPSGAAVPPAGPRR
jgi:hypothetical protein